MDKAVIIIPTYNEEAVIAETIKAVFAAVRNRIDTSVELLIFDSGSVDRTQEIVAEMQKKNPALHMKTEQQKTGLGSAYHQAMQYAINRLAADIVIEFDADLSHQPYYIPLLLEAMHSYDVVIGSRYIDGGSIPENWGWHRKLLSILGNQIARFTLSRKYKDFTSGFRATRASLLRKVLPRRFISHNYAYKLELLWLLHKAGAAILEYPIHFVDRTKGQSKLPANSVVDSLYVLGKLRFRELKQYFRMCMVGLLGITIQCAVYNILRMGISPVNAAQFAVLTAILSNFTFNQRYTFKKSRLIWTWQKFKSFFCFGFYSLGIILFQSYWLKFGIYYLGSGFLRENGMIMFGIVIGSILNYQVYSRIIWRDSTNDLTALV